MLKHHTPVAFSIGVTSEFLFILFLLSFFFTQKTGITIAIFLNRPQNYIHTIVQLLTKVFKRGQKFIIPHGEMIYMDCSAP